MTKYVQQSKHILCSIIFFSEKLCRSQLYIRHHNFPRSNVEKHTAGHATYDNIIRRMRFACWIPKTTNTHSQCVTLIAFALQQWIH